MPFVSPWFLRNYCNRQTQQTTVRQFDDNNFIPSSIEVFTPNAQTITPNAEIPFSDTLHNTGVSFKFTNGNSFIEVIASGIYKVSFVASLKNATSEEVNLSIAIDGTKQDASTIYQQLRANEFDNVSIEMVLRVTDTPVKISIINSSLATFNAHNSMLSIVRTGNF